MKRIPDASLKQLNSFSVEARAGQLLTLESEEDLQAFTSEHRFDVERDLILGGGSNILFAGDVEGSVVLNRITGKRIIEDSNDEVLVEACAGENWHQLVLWCLDQGLSGIENLSLIPLSRVAFFVTFLEILVAFFFTLLADLFLTVGFFAGFLLGLFSVVIMISHRTG